MTPRDVFSFFRAMKDLPILVEELDYPPVLVRYPGQKPYLAIDFYQSNISAEEQFSRLHTYAESGIPHIWFFHPSQKLVLQLSGGELTVVEDHLLQLPELGVTVDAGSLM